MPILNKEKCFTLPLPREVPTYVELNIPQLIDFIGLYCKGSNRDILQQRFKDHIGENSTYQYREFLKSELKIIQAYFADTTNSEDKKCNIADKLYEAIEECSPGWHARIDSVLLGLERSNSIDDFLALIRRSIVDSVAHGCTEEVHLHNAFFIHAHNLGFGVQPLNEADPYSRALSLEEEALLIKAIEGYTPMLILNDFRESLEAELRSHYEYQGKKDTGYSFEVYGRIETYLKTIFGDKSDITIRNVFVFVEDENEEEICADINWRFLQNTLWKKMRAERYFTFTKEESDLFEALYQEDSRSLTNLLSQPHYQHAIRTLKLSQYPEFIQGLPEQNKQCLIEHLFFYLTKKTVFNFSAQEFSNHYTQFMALHPGEPEVQAAYYQKIWSIWFKKKKNERVFKAFASQDLATQRGVVGILGFLNEVDLVAILQYEQQFPQYFLTALKYNLGAALKIESAITKLPANKQAVIWTQFNGLDLNFLLHALLHSPLREVGLVLKFISRLPQEQKIAILTAQNSGGYNALLAAIEYRQICVGELLTAISSLSLEQQKVIWTEESEETGYNAFMAAARYSPELVSSIMTGIVNLPAEVQAAIWSHKNEFGENGFTLWAYHHPDPANIAMMFDILRNLEFRTQVKILKAVDFFEESPLQDYKKVYLKEAIARLSENTPVERSIKLRLQSMTFRAETKQAAVLDALNALKEAGAHSSANTDISRAIIKALADPRSDLYGALNIKRYGPLSFSKETGTLKSVKAAAQLTFFKKTSASEIENGANPFIRTSSHQ